METSFNPSAYERKWQQWWTERELFRAEAGSDRPGFCIMIPPPNVTGKLHMGHALQSTLQDLLTRWRRMQGYNALWLPGTDHAGIATQLMVERQVVEEGTTREAMGREAFLARTWKWKENYQGNIRRQLDALGASCDWTRERFTLDDGLSVAVREAFVRLYEEGAISRGEYMVNWSPGLDTAISDLEVEMREVAGKLYHVSYPLASGEGEVVVATTRPETMLGDTAIAYHPADERYSKLAGQAAVLPLVGRELPFVADEVVEPDFGSGLVKVTPAHDLTDFEIGRRHQLESIQVIDRLGKMTAAAGKEWQGLDRFEARQRVVAKLQEAGRLVEVEEYTHNVGHCQRSGVPIEPLVSTQWFCEVAPMAERALAGVDGTQLELVPETWRKTWEHWLENIRPWCISRQLWWGHQIPAWYTPEGEIFVARSREEAVAAAGTEDLEQDPDVLDTWFSSALWPFSTLGWPEETEDLATFYPTDVLVTGFDIVFFWVARMVMTGIHFTGELPFRTVHLTGLVRDAEGQKMSKTKGNTVDPIELVNEYGADAMRFTLAALDSPGRDIPLDLDRMAGYRAFGNKIWNAVRFSLARTEGAEVALELDARALAAPERWILSRLSRVEEEVNERFEAMRFDEACRVLYGFFWGELCDWYIELAKPALVEPQAERPQVAVVLLTAIERSLRLLHPVMPFLTEELWQRLPGRERVDELSIAVAPYPMGEKAWQDETIEASMATFIEVIGWVRNRRAELGLKPKEAAQVQLVCGDAELARFLGEQGPLAQSLANLGQWQLVDALPAAASRDRIAGIDVAFLVEGRDLEAEERARDEGELAELGPQIDRLTDLLGNADFTAKAPPQVVARNRERLEELESRRRVIVAALGRAGG